MLVDRLRDSPSECASILHLEWIPDSMYPSKCRQATEKKIKIDKWYH